MNRTANEKYGTFGFVFPIPVDRERHRCDIARDKLRERYGNDYVESLIMHVAEPTDTPGEDPDGIEYYRFAGKVLMEDTEP